MDPELLSEVRTELDLSGEVKVSVDWLAVTIHAGPVQVMDLVNGRLLGLSEEEREGYLWAEGEGGGRLRGFQERCSAGGLTLFYAPADRDREYCHLVIPGEKCREYGVGQLQLLLNEIDAAGWAWKVTRVDLAADGAPFTVPEFYAECRGGRLRSKVNRTGEWLQLIEGSNDDQVTHTCYLGRRSSERFARVYDAHGFTRFELEIKGDRAELLGLQLAQLTDAQLGPWVIGQVRDFCDLGTVVHTREGSRTELWKKWSAFIAGLPRLRVPLTRVPMTIERAVRWAFQGTAPTLAAIAESAGPEFVSELLASGRRRWGSRHRLLINEGRTHFAAAGGYG